ncbi:MAG: T9SS type A sorting domain-containing protein [Bacteroidia bacterium]
MRAPLKLLFISCLLMTLALNSKAQSRLEFNSNILYSDSIYSNSDSIFLDVKLTNISNIDASDLTIMATVDSGGVSVFNAGGLFTLLANDTFDTLLSLVPGAIGNFNIKQEITFTAFTRTPGIAPAEQKADLYFQKLPTEKPFLSLSQNIEKDSFNFDDYYPFRLNLVNTGEVDFYRRKGIDLYYSINGNNAEKLFTTRAPIIRKEGNIIEVFDSIPITNLQFKKGGGNIVVVWPVGFLKVDSVADTIVVDWPVFANEHKMLKKLSIHPNPTKSFIYLNNNNSHFEEVRILNIQGEVILNGKGTVRLDVSGLQAGFYFIEIIHNNEKLRSSFIKQ